MIRVGRKTVVLALLLVLALLALPALAYLGGATPSPVVVRSHGTESVTVTVGSAFAFTPSDFEVTPGDQVTITVEQLDSAEHTFTLSSVANYSLNPSTNSSSDLATFFSEHPPLVYVHINGTQGETQTRTFTAPRLGTYQFVCEISGHFQSGMWGLMGSGVAVGPPPGPGIPTGFYIIAGVVVSLVVIAIVLGFVIGKREGGRYEMPPERLGYPEPPNPAGAPPRSPPG